MRLENSELGRKIIQERQKLIRELMIRPATVAEKRKATRSIFFESAILAPAVSSDPNLHPAGEFSYNQVRENKYMFDTILKHTHFDFDAFARHLEKSCEKPKRKLLTMEGWQHAGLILLAGKKVQVITKSKGTNKKTSTISLFDQDNNGIASVNKIASKTALKAFHKRRHGFGKRTRLGDAEISIFDHASAEHALRLIFSKQFVPVEREEKK